MTDIPQLEFCHARNGQSDFCTPMQYLPWPPETFPNATSMQRAVLEVLMQSNWLSHSDSVTSSKVAKLKMHSLDVVESLPNDFWKQEVLGWEQESMASMQIAMTLYATGAPGSDAEGQTDDNWWIKPESQGQKTLCSAQKMRKSGGFV
jgi:hypothetical protein